MEQLNFWRDSNAGYFCRIDNEGGKGKQKEGGAAFIIVGHGINRDISAVEFADAYY